MRLTRLLFPIAALPAAIAAAQSPAAALITIHLFDDGPNLKMSVSGSLDQLPAPSSTISCGLSGAISGELQSTLPNVKGVLCSGPVGDVNSHKITGPTGFGGTTVLAPATSVAGSSFWLSSSTYTANPEGSSVVGIDPNYIFGTPYFSEAIFAGTNLANQGLVAGFTGTYTIDGTTESVRLVLSPPASVPGPLPLLGAGAALAWSRRLRNRITTSRTSAPGVTAA